MASKEEKQERVLLGRFRSSLSMGIVGLPNVGKSSLFNVLTKLSVPAENYPFCTINPNEARVSVPDARFDWFCEYFKPLSKVPTSLSVTDIAGLIRGASKGEGLGNAFLSHIHEVDGIYHVLRIFDDEEITHVEGSIDPVRDLEIINEELMIKDLDVTQKQREKLEREIAHKKDKKKLQEVEVMLKIEECLKAKKLIRFADWKLSEVDVLNSLNLLTAKPVVYLVNMTEGDYIKKSNKWLAKIKKWVDENSGSEPIVPFCCAVETKLLGMETDAQRKTFLEEKKITSAVNKLVTAGYHALSLIHFFTTGVDEVRCWTIRKGTKAPGAAGVIHTDFERGFICAEVMKFEDFKELGSESAVKASGKYRQEGKNYEVVDGDVMFFKANTSSLKKK